MIKQQRKEQKGEKKESIYVYDFDETIYNGDSTKDFYRYCYKRYPQVRKYIFLQIWAVIKYIFGFYKWTQLKSKWLGYIKYVDEIDLVVDQFWEEHKKKIKGWYLKRDHSNDVIISASPEFLLKKVCDYYLNVRLLIATKVDKKSGDILGLNCYGNQKVKRLREKIKNYQIKKFYSDSLSDEPLAKEADESYIVQGDKMKFWNDYKLPKKTRLKYLFFSREFILFVLIGFINTINSMIFAVILKFYLKGAVLAFCVGYLLSNIVAYLLNSAIIFKEKLSYIKYFKFLVSYIPNFIIQWTIVFVICDILKWHPYIAYCLAALIGVPVSFLFVRLFAFKSQNSCDFDLFAYREF